MSESVYLIRTAQPSDKLVTLHLELANHLQERGLTIVEHYPQSCNSEGSVEDQWPGLNDSLAVIAELTEADETVRPPLEAAILLGKPILKLFNRYAANPTKSETDVSDLAATRSLRCTRPYMARVMIDLFLEMQVDYPLTTQLKR